jgi:thymidine kinase
VLIRSSKGGPTEGGKYPILACDELPPDDDVAQYDTIGVDEGHRFAGIAEWADRQANLGKLVEVSALDGTYTRAPFPNIVELVSVCERVQKLDSVCPITGLPAPFSVLRDGISIPISRFGLIQFQQGLTA